jgi:hypothetical protein
VRATKKVIVLPAGNAEKTLEKTINQLILYFFYLW